MGPAFLVAFPAVLFIVDPLGAVPLFLAMTSRDSAEKCRAMALRACVAGAGVLVFFALSGGVLFRVFGVTLPAFRVAGGLLLLLTALDMLRARPSATKLSAEEAREGEEREDIAIVPLAMPLLAGPGAIATVMALMAQHSHDVASGAAVVLAVVVTFALSYLVLRSAPAIKRVLKLTGIAILERVFGLILAAIGVQFTFDGARTLWAG